jgi:L-serine deaminase
MYMSVAELVTAAKKTKKPIYELMIEQEMETSQTSREENLAHDGPESRRHGSGC